MARLIIAALPFIFLGVLTQVSLKRTPFKETIAGLVGAWIAVLVSYLWAWGMYFKDYVTPHAGANITVGLIVFASPMFVPLFMLGGYWVGHLFDHKTAP